MNNYMVYHLHTQLSNPTTIVDSITNYKHYIDRAKELGMKAICFSEHGNVLEWLHKKEYAEKNVPLTKKTLEKTAGGLR